MKISFIVTAVALFATSATHAGTTCSDSTGKTRLVVTTTNAPNPKPGQVLSDVQIYIDNTLISETKYFQGKAAEIGPVSSDFDPNIRHVFLDYVDNDGSVRVYGTKMTLNGHLNDADKHHFRLPWTKFVICTDIATK